MNRTFPFRFALPLGVLAALVLLGAGATRAQSPTEGVAPREAETLSRAGFSSQLVAALLDPNNRLAPGEAASLLYERLWDRQRASFDAFQAQSTTGNFALAEQQGDDNVATIEQVGARNIAVLVQQGSANVSDVLQQGTENLYGSWLTGDANQTEVVQLGVGNVYLLDFAGSGLAGHRVVQEGVGNEAVQLGLTETPFSIEQHGNGMTLVIRHNSGLGL
ncbi:MAG TPA: hypothetical protein VD962_05800 [Rubricoccaceae bacterium]|nr:hypothetical protein [Rubricoccaceae bacterium]